MDEEIYEKEVCGEYNTFRVYLYLLRAKEGSARETQRALDFSSPALASHHLEKLEKLGLASKDAYGTYHVIPKSFGKLRSFILVGNTLVPRAVFLVAAFAAMIVGFLLYLPRNQSLVWALLPSTFGLIASFYQTLQNYRSLRSVCKK